MTLAGFRSRWSTPRSCAAARPAQSWRAISSALSSGSRPIRRSSDDRSSPSTYSIVRNSWRVRAGRRRHLADVVDAADVGVRHLPRRAHFVVELREPHGIAREAFGQELQGDGLAEPQVVGAIHLAHAAPAQQAENPVAAVEHDAGGEPAVINRAGRAQPAAGGRRCRSLAAGRELGFVFHRAILVGRGGARCEVVVRVRSRGFEGARFGVQVGCGCLSACGEGDWLRVALDLRTLEPSKLSNFGPISTVLP